MRPQSGGPDPDGPPTVDDLAAVRRLVGRQAHELNNMLAIIHGQAQLLAGMAGSDEVARQDAEEILEAARRAIAVTREMTAFSDLRRDDDDLGAG